MAAGSPRRRARHAYAPTTMPARAAVWRIACGLRELSGNGEHAVRLDCLPLLTAVRGFQSDSPSTSPTTPAPFPKLGDAGAMQYASTTTTTTTTYCAACSMRGSVSTPVLNAVYELTMISSSSLAFRRRRRRCYGSTPACTPARCHPVAILRPRESPPRWTTRRRPSRLIGTRSPGS